jgi:hypothetical protein
MIYPCSDERRREAVRMLASSGWNGIDFLNVLDASTLQVHLINPLSANALNKANVRIEGGVYIRDIVVVDAHVVEKSVLMVKVNKQGDDSNYTLHLQADADCLKLDPLLSAVNFTFRLTARGKFDQKTEVAALIDASSTPEINYLAKEYTSFRQLMLDRLSVLLPQWTERSVADIGVMLVEILAYVSDHLSYQQDVLATEANLSTARRRISVRRYARLLDYFINEGCNARVWVQVRVNTDKEKQGQTAPLPKHTKLFTRVAGQNTLVVDEQLIADQATSEQVETFETMDEVDGLYVAHNEMHFYTWGARECFLARGATRATLCGAFPHLRRGDVLIFKEVLNPRTGRREDADPTHRCAVRLTNDAVAHDDPIGQVFSSTGIYTRKDPAGGYSMPITEIVWNGEDALPFPLCISTKTGCEADDIYLENVSVALGNIVLADHGYTTTKNEPIIVTASPRFYPSLNFKPLTWVVPYQRSNQSASAIMYYTSHDAMPAIHLKSETEGKTTLWHPQRDLMASRPFEPHFVVETDDNGWGHLRFGDDQHSLHPAAGTTFQATYRIGNGVRGNIGAESLEHIAKNGYPLNDWQWVSKVDNPLPASHGVEPQSIEDVRQNVSRSFSIQERGVTPLDYIDIAKRDVEVQRANAVMRWTGSWYTLFLALERAGGMPIDDAFLCRLRTRLERFRMAGTHLEIVAPIYISLEIEIKVQVKPDFIRSVVRDALMELFSNHQRPDGQRGIFSPGNYSFGQAVYLSDLYVAASPVPGIDALDVLRFQRQGLPGFGLQEGVLPMDWLEIARLDNDPSNPERGIFTLIMEGGR